MKRFWGLRPYMEISDFISSVEPKQLLSSEFNDILSKCEDFREYLYLARLAFDELEDGEDRQKIIKTILKRALQVCQGPWGYFHVARSVYENLNDKKLSKKIIVKQIKRFNISDYFLLCKQNILSKKQIKTAIKRHLNSVRCSTTVCSLLGICSLLLPISKGHIKNNDKKDGLT